MVIDGKGKLFGKISIIDILIIVVVLAAIAGIGYKYTKSQTVSPFVSQDDIVLQFLGYEIPDESANAIEKGGLVKDSVQNVVLGQVTDIKIGPSIVWDVNSEGKQTSSPRKGYSSVVITVEGKGIFGRNGVSFGGSDYYIGQYFPELKVGNAICAMRITVMHKKEA